MWRLWYLHKFSIFKLYKFVFKLELILWKILNLDKCKINLFNEPSTKSAFSFYTCYSDKLEDELFKYCLFKEQLQFINNVQFEFIN